MNESITSEDLENMEPLSLDPETKPETGEFLAENLAENLGQSLDQDRPEDASDGELWSYEVPRPWLSVGEAASMLGRSVRAMERSVIGRWGNKLPEGWQARRVRLDGQDQWRIVPPPGFRVKHSKRMDAATKAALARFEQERKDEESFIQRAEQEEDLSFQPGAQGYGAGTAERLEQSYLSSAGISECATRTTSPYDYSNEEKEVPTKSAEGQSGFSLEKLLHSAGQLAQKELASLGLNVKNQLIADRDNYASSLEGEHTIVIDRSDEVEKLLRELANVQKELSEERRQHMDDLRLLNQAHNNMRLLEVNATQTSELKEDLKLAQKLLSEHRQQYQAYLALPWWKKIFKSQP